MKISYKSLIQIGVLIIGLFCISCEKVLIEPDIENTPTENFEVLWNTMDKKYASFAFKKIDWDSVYAVYRPQIRDDMSDRELFDVLAEMLNVLRDGHVNIRSPFDWSRNWDWHLDAPHNFNRNLLERHYWGKDYHITGPLINTVLDSVGYIYYGSFSSTVNTSYLDIVADRFKGLKGIIIDVRNNGGGSTANASRIAGYFAEESSIYGYEQFKNGPGHNDLSDPIAQKINPTDNVKFQKPVVVLTNRRSFSASNDFILRMRALPNVTVIGDTTGGGGGVPVNYELPNGWNFRFSSSVTTSPEGLNIEDGIPPDIHQNLTENDEAQNIDTILERALKFLQN